MNTTLYYTAVIVSVVITAYVLEIVKKMNKTLYKAVLIAGIATTAYALESQTGTGIFAGIGLSLIVVVLFEV